MAKYRKKPIVIEATQWFKNGDHPKDNSISIQDPLTDEYRLSWGEIVDRFHDPDLKYVGRDNCSVCKKPYLEHGSINTLEGMMTVCPGDWIITGVKGEYYPCKPDIFEATYEPAWEELEE